MQKATSAETWAFILEHFGTISRYCGKMYHPSFEYRGTSREDFRQEVLANVAEHFDGYDPQRAGPSTWLWWRVMRVRQSLLNQCARQPISADPLPADKEERGNSVLFRHPASGPSAEALVLLAEVYAEATPLEVEALDAMADRLGRSDIYAELGVPHAVIADRVAALRYRTMRRPKWSARP